MTSPVAYREFLESRGVSLEALGGAERAVCREDALRVVELVESEGQAILGGDVYVADGGRIESAYANGYSDRRQNEVGEAFVARSSAETRSYITNYPAGATVCAGTHRDVFAAFGCVPSTYSTVSLQDRLSNAISESRSLNTPGHSVSQRVRSVSSWPGLHET